MRALRVSLLCAAAPPLALLVLLPLLIYFFPHLMQHLFFLNFRRIPFTDYQNVSANGVKVHGRHFTLDSAEEVRLGVWHMLPADLSSSLLDPPSDEHMEALLSRDGALIVVYAHGNSFDRTISHRCELYNVLTSMNYHVIAFDYRGYGDSTGSPSEQGIVHDTRVVYEYVKKRAGRNPVFVWGHSMGTGVSTKVVMDLSLEGAPPSGLVLEAPFNNLRDVVMHHPFSIPIRWMPQRLVDSLILNPLRSVGLNMDSDERIVHVTCPILILHAGDDHVIPVKLGRALKDAAENAALAVEYVEFAPERSLKHKFIYMAEELPSIVRSLGRKRA